MTLSIKVCNLGRMTYSRALAIQEQVRRAKLDAISVGKTDIVASLIIVEHYPVYTIGIRSKEYSEELETKLRRLGADFQQVHRGGLITFHGPGQLVAYPIIELKRMGLGVRGYVEGLEQTIIRTCREFGIKAGTTENTGVWVNEDRKIAAIGVNARRYVTSHGLALNCNVDLDWFEHIVPCGIEGKSVTSLSKELRRDVTVEEATDVFLEAFKKTFNCNLRFK